MTGTIKKLLKDKRCGFITAGKMDYFFHESSLKNGNFESLQEGQDVTFEDAEGNRGPRAEDIFI